MQASQEDSFKRQSNVRFVRHLFKSPKATRSRTCPHLIISTDWWMFSLLKMAAHRPRNAAVVKRTTLLPLTVSSAKTFSALLALKLINAWRPQELIAMCWYRNYKSKMFKSWSTDPSCVHSNITKINRWNFIAKNAKFPYATSAV